MQTGLDEDKYHLKFFKNLFTIFDYSLYFYFYFFAFSISKLPCTMQLRKVMSTQWTHL